MSKVLVKSLNDNDEYWGLNPKYQNILQLHEKLTQADIPHELYRLMDGWTIVYPNLETRCFDVITHRGSYGHEDDLMEAMGGFIDDVRGHLTLDEAFAMFIEVHERRSELSLGY